MILVRASAMPSAGGISLRAAARHAGKGCGGWWRLLAERNDDRGRYVHAPDGLARDVRQPVTIEQSVSIAVWSVGSICSVTGWLAGSAVELTAAPSRRQMKSASRSS